MRNYDKRWQQQQQGQGEYLNMEETGFDVDLKSGHFLAFLLSNYFKRLAIKVFLNWPLWILSSNYYFIKNGQKAKGRSGTNSDHSRAKIT